MKQIDDDQLVIDMHAHLFNADDLPVRGFLKNVFFRRAGLLAGPMAAVLAAIGSRAPTYADDRLRLEGGAPGRRGVVPDVPAQLVRLGRMSMVATESRLRLVQRLDRLCTEPAASESRVDLFVTLCVDLEQASGSNARATPQQQFDFQERLSAASFAGRVPGSRSLYLTFVGFDPRRCPDDPRNNLARVMQHVGSNGAIGVKLYPAMGFRPLGNGPGGEISGPVDEQLLALYAWCVAEHVPITAHCSPANAAAGAEGMARPLNWVPVLELFPKLRLNLAHVGGIGEGGWLDEAAAIVTDVAQAGGHVYCDVGNHDLVGEGDRFFDRLEEMRDEPEHARLLDRMMFGTDFWFLLMHRRSQRFVHDYAASVHARFGDATYRRFMGEAAREFLGFDDVANRNRVRVLARFAAEGMAVNPRSSVIQRVFPDA